MLSAAACVQGRQGCPPAQARGGGAAADLYGVPRDRLSALPSLRPTPRKLSCPGSCQGPATNRVRNNFLGLWDARDSFCVFWVCFCVFIVLCHKNKKKDGQPQGRAAPVEKKIEVQKSRRSTCNQIQDQLRKNVRNEGHLLEKTSRIRGGVISGIIARHRPMQPST